jgi:large subunit ribosomal protein L15
MKLHDLRPAEGSTTARTRVGRGISAGKGKTAGRGTKGQKARAGGSIPPWFEGGQTPLHMRIPKLRGFRNRGKVHYEIVNVGDIAARIEAGAFEGAGTTPKKGEPMTINADILRAVGLVRDVKRPLKILGNGDLSTALFVVADAFTKSATEKIESAGGSVNILEVPAEALPALGLDGEPKRTRERRTAAGRAAEGQETAARARRDAATAEAAEAQASAATAKAAKADKAEKAEKADKPERADKGDKPAKADKADPAKAVKPEPAPDAEPVEAVAGDTTTATVTDESGLVEATVGGDEPATNVDVADEPAERADAVASEPETAEGEAIATEAADALDDDAPASTDESA